MCVGWFQVSGLWFLVSGFWFLVSGFWSQVLAPMCRDAPGQDFASTITN